MPGALIGRCANDFRKEGFRRAITVEDAAFAPFLVIEDELHRDAGAARPVGERWIACVAGHVARIRQFTITR